MHPKGVVIKDLNKEEKDKYFIVWFIQLGKSCEY